MKENEDHSFPELNFETRLPGETALAFTYFTLYRDAGSDRTLRALCDEEIRGKKRSLAQIGRWSSQFHWTARAEAHDAHIALAAFQQLAEQRQNEITAFIAKDMSMALELQDLCKTKLNTLATGDEGVDSRELRQLALAYRESRQWLIQLTGIFSEDSDDDEKTD